MHILDVRQALPSDAPGVSQLRLEALRDHPEAFSSDYQVESARTLADWEAWIQRADGTSGILYLAYVEGEPAGMAAAFLGHSPKTQHSAAITSFYVRPAHRRHEIGTRLMQACIDWARAHGVDILKLGVTDANAGAIRFYAGLGFRVYGLEPSATRVQGVDYAELLMARELDDPATVSFPDELLAELDRIARECGRSRDDLLREAVRAYVEAHRSPSRPGDDPRVRAAMATQDALSRKAPGAGQDSTADVRRRRESR